MPEFKIIVDDGFVAYEYNTDITSEYSIDDVVEEINNRCSFELDKGKMIASYDCKEEIAKLIEEKEQLLKVLNQLVVIKHSYMELLNKHLEKHPELNEVIKKHS